MKLEAPNPLLSAVLDEDAAFRRATLQLTVALARRRRHTRFAGRALAAAAVLSVAASLVHPPPPVPAPTPFGAVTSVRVVRSVPLAAGQSVRTGNALFATIKSAPAGHIVFAGRSNNVVRIKTRTSALMLDYLSDQQLLAAFPREHPALVSPGTAEARLVFY